VAAKVLELQLLILKVRGPSEWPSAFSEMSRWRARGLHLLNDSTFASQKERIAELALQNRLTTMSGETGFAEAGGLMFYGPNQTDLFRRAATYVDKILKGAKPANLPVEQPTKFELVINLKTAKQIGVTIPPNVLARADKVIR
jgi:putative ABC transport system substrate-binding protein